MYQQILEKIRNKKIAILGFGLEGKSTYQFIRKYLDIPLTIIDKKNILESNEELLKEDSNLTCIWGEDYLEHLEGFDLIMKSPGVITKDIDTHLLPFTSQLELLLEVAASQIIGITATKGKSTTCTLTYEALKKNGKDAYLLGNIGNPIFDDLDINLKWQQYEENASQILIARQTSQLLKSYLL